MVEVTKVKRTRRTPEQMAAAKRAEEDAKRDIEDDKQTGRPSREATARRERNKRVPFGQLQMKMSVDQQTLDKLASKGMIPRWVNDENHGQRIRNAENGGYEFVISEGSEIIGSSTADEDKRIRKLVGSEKDGSPKYAYLMAIHEDFHNEDMQAKEAVNAQIDDSIRAGTPKGTQSLNVSSDKVKMSSEVTYKP